jgi:serine/threonine-protein kinase
MYKSTKYFTIGGAIVVTAAIAMTAVAVTPPETYQNVSTGKCLDSNTDGKVYTLGCNGGSFQKWTVIRTGSYIKFKNLATGKCLDSNTDGKVYTLACNGGNFQNWK